MPQAELKRPEADLVSMRQLAGDPSRFLHLHEINGLAARVPDDRQVSVTEAPRALWSSMFFLVLMGLLLTVEWALRKTFNMM